MSAWIVSKRHIDYLVSAALEEGRDYTFRFGQDPAHELSLESATEVGRMLWQENYASVAYRYGDREGVGLPGPVGITKEKIDAYQYTPVRTASVVAYKQASCYDYQSCEHPGWPDSDAYAFIQELQNRIAYDVIIRDPLYKAAPWGID